MKNFILGLIMIFTLSVTFSSIGFATPIDAKIEKTFIFDEAVISVDSMISENVAETSYRYDLGKSLENHYDFAILREKVFDSHFTLNREHLHLNNKILNEKINPNLHILVPWQRS